MLKKSTKNQYSPITNSAIELVIWPVKNVQAFQTTCNHPKQTPLEINTHLSVSKPTYGHFNLGLHVDDNESQVENNRLYIEEKLLNDKKIQWLEQVHGNHVVYVDEVSTTPIIADACITDNKNVALAIMTADCLPILLSNNSGDKIAAIHGGWRSLAGDIIEKTVNKMTLDVSDIQAWLGPCIGMSAFEVGVEVYNVFIEKNQQYVTAFHRKSNGKYCANLHTIAQLQLKELGISAVSALNECTYNLNNKYYSYRKNPITGRMATIITRK